MRQLTALPQTSHTYTVQTTPHPAQIPHEVVGNPRPHPPIPATIGSKSPAHASDPRLSPLRPEAPRPGQPLPRGSAPIPTARPRPSALLGLGFGDRFGTFRGGSGSLKEGCSKE